MTETNDALDDTVAPASMSFAKPVKSAPVDPAPCSGVQNGIRVHTYKFQPNGVGPGPYDDYELSQANEPFFFVVP